MIDLEELRRKAEAMMVPVKTEADAHAWVANMKAFSAMTRPDVVLAMVRVCQAAGKIVSHSHSCVTTTHRASFNCDCGTSRLWEAITALEALGGLGGENPSAPGAGGL